MVKEANKENFQEILKSDKPVLVDFWAPWCGPCKMMGPEFEALGEEMTEVEFVKVNTEENPELAGQNGVQGIPCLILFKNGEEAERFVGFMPKDILKEKLKSVL